MRTSKSLLIAAMSAILATLSCTKENEPTINKEVTDTEMIVSGVWKSGETISLDRHLIVPVGESLTIEPGVKIIVSTDGVGVNHVPVEISVKGSLYAIGTEAKPIFFTVEESKRTDANTFSGLWGGIVAYDSCPEMAFDHVVIEYTGAEVIEGSPAADAGIYTAGDDMYPQITTNNIEGKYVVTNSIIRNGASDGIYLMGGNAIVTNNIFIANGSTGGESVNMKAGVKADIAGNIMYSPNTNGLKLSSSGQSETRGQLVANAYNNTIFNAGWRRDGEKGGCIYVEKNALVTVVNNLLVNCKFRAMTPKYTDPNKPDAGYDDKSVIDYNYYAAGPQTTPIVGDATVGSPVEGYNINNKNYSPYIDTHSIISSQEQLYDPQFSSYDINAPELTSYSFDASWDFHLKAGSDALKGADGQVSPCFANGLSIGSVNYVSPSVQAYFGAFGTK